LIGALVTVCAAVFISCRGEKTYRVEVKDGVRFIHNIKPVSEKPAASLIFVRKVGELEPKDPNYMFLRPVSVVEDDEGNIYVLDTKDFCVKKFGADGTFLRRFGRRGQGPGEFQYPMTIGIVGQTRLIVSSMSSDFNIFDLDGKYVDHFRLSQYQGILPAFMKSDRLVGYSFELDGENSRDNKILKIYDFKGQAQHKFGEPFLLETAQKTWSANFLQITVDDKDNIFVAFLNQNRIEKYSGTGRLILSINRDLPYNIEYRYEKSTMDIGGKVVPIDQNVFTPVSRGIGLDGRGRIWVLAYQKAAPQGKPPKDFTLQDYLAFEVYDGSGILLSRVPLPRELARFDNMTMHGNHLFFVDPFDQSCVYEFAVVDGKD
jgi:6-bladed beta-propeller